MKRFKKSERVHIYKYFKKTNTIYYNTIYGGQGTMTTTTLLDLKFIVERIADNPEILELLWS